MNNADVIIIGSGAGGGAAAWRFALSGVKVLLIEAGPRFDPLSDYRQDRNDWETAFPTKEGSVGPYEVAPLQALTDDTLDIRSWSKKNGPYVTGNQRQSFGYHHVRGLGGSSLHFTGEAHRMNPASMRLLSDHAVGADWPLGYEELEPFYLVAEQIVGAAGPNEDLRCPRSAPYPTQAHPISFSSEVLRRGAQSLGYNVQANSLAVPSVPYQDRPDCNYCGGCLRGCQRGDKGSIDVTYLKYAEETGNLDIMSSAEVLEIETDGNQITAVVVAVGNDIQRLSASKYVVAAGAIQTPRLLLNSASTHSPEGLANESGQVGRNLMETLLTTTSALHPSPLGSHRGLPVDWVCWDYNAPDSLDDIVGGFRFGPAMAESDLVGPVAYANRVVEGWGRAHKEAMRNTFGRVLSIAAIGESLPHDQSFVDLSEQVDKYGKPIARIHSFLDDMAVRRLRKMAEVSREVIRASGCKDVIEEFSSVDAFSSTHVFGTCRMGSDEQSSVVDPFCKSHRWPNLYICDASVFPSSGGGESPGLTIQALALRMVDNILSAKGSK